VNSILIVEDDPPLRLILEQVLRKRGFETDSADSAAAALSRFEQRSFDVLVTDLMLRPMDGIALMEAIHGQGRDVPVIFITANDDVQTAMRAMRSGAFDYVVKPLKIPELLDTVDRAVTYRARLAAVKPATGAPPADFMRVIAESPAMRRAVESARRLALTNVPLLICGEPGTGKSIFAHLIHELSHRREGPFITADCERDAEERVAEYLQDLKDGSAASASGTLFLDHVEGLSQRLQKMLADLLAGAAARDHRPAPSTARLLAATSARLADRVAGGTFLPALYQRLSLLNIVLPSLRERLEDRAPLALELARRIAGGPVEFEPAALALIAGYAWPGNGREMETVIAQSWQASGGKIVRVEHLPPVFKTVTPDASVLDQGAVALRGQSLVGFLKSRGTASAKAGGLRGHRREAEVQPS